MRINIVHQILLFNVNIFTIIGYQCMFFFIHIADKILSSPLGEALPTLNIDKRAFYVQSPIGKFMVEDIDTNLEPHTYGKENNLSSTAERSLNIEIKSSNKKLINVFCLFVYLYLTKVYL